MNSFFETLDDLLAENDGAKFLSLDPLDEFGKRIEEDYLNQNDFEGGDELNIAVDYLSLDIDRISSHFNRELFNMHQFALNGGSFNSEKYSSLIKKLNFYSDRASYNYSLLVRFKPYFKGKDSLEGSLDEVGKNSCAYVGPEDFDISNELKLVSQIKKLLALEREFPGSSREVYSLETDFANRLNPLLLREDYSRAAELQSNFEKSLRAKCNEVYLQLKR